jgi:ribosomal protein S18 acetylase RimI-like enzyme
MYEADIDAVRQVDAASFAAWYASRTGEPVELPPRTRANALACLRKDPEGCFVAEEDGGVVGLIFSRTWGSVGWCGTFAVLPEYQGRGIGKQLMAASLDYLRQDSGRVRPGPGRVRPGPGRVRPGPGRVRPGPGRVRPGPGRVRPGPGRVVGLETMPESSYNLGLYLRQGFQARFPTLLMIKELDQDAPTEVCLASWSSAGAEVQERWLADLREATGQVKPGLDYAKEIVMTAEHSQGETLMLLDGDQAVGMANVWLVGSREGTGEELANVQVVAVHPAHTDETAFRTLLDGIEALAYLHGKQEVLVPVNARYTWALEQLLGRGYRVVGARVRMVFRGTDGSPSPDSNVNLSRWAG